MRYKSLFNEINGLGKQISTKGKRQAVVEIVLAFYWVVVYSELITISVGLTLQKLSLNFAYVSLKPF
jgi:hypothetical protein